MHFNFIYIFFQKGITYMEECSIRPKLPLLAQASANAKMLLLKHSMLMQHALTRIALSEGYGMVVGELEKTTFLLPHFSLKLPMRYHYFILFNFGYGFSLLINLSHFWFIKNLFILVPKNIFKLLIYKVLEQILELEVSNTLLVSSNSN